MNYFSKNLKFLRQKRKLSISELAQQLKINQSTISRWESDNMGATIDNAYDVSQFFNVSIADLVGRDLALNDLPEAAKIQKNTADNNIQITINKNAPVTAETIVEINKILMDLINKQNDK